LLGLCFFIAWSYSVNDLGCSFSGWIRTCNLPVPCFRLAFTFLSRYSKANALVQCIPLPCRATSSSRPSGTFRHLVPLFCSPPIFFFRERFPLWASFACVGRIFLPSLKIPCVCGVVHVPKVSFLTPIKGLGGVNGLPPPPLPYLFFLKRASVLVSFLFETTWTVSALKL